MGAKILAQIRDKEMLIVLSQVLADLVRGEFQQLESEQDSQERLDLYRAKTSEIYDRLKLMEYSLLDYIF